MSLLSDRLRLPAFLLLCLVLAALPAVSLFVVPGTTTTISRSVIGVTGGGVALVMAITASWVAAHRQWVTWRVLRRGYGTGVTLLAGWCDLRRPGDFPGSVPLVPGCGDRKLSDQGGKLLLEPILP